MWHARTEYGTFSNDARGLCWLRQRYRLASDGKFSRVQTFTSVHLAFVVMRWLRLPVTVNVWLVWVTTFWIASIAHALETKAEHKLGTKMRCCGKFHVRYLRTLLHETTAVAYKETWSHLLSAIAATKPKAIAVPFFWTTFSYSFSDFSDRHFKKHRNMSWVCIACEPGQRALA